MTTTQAPASTTVLHRWPTLLAIALAALTLSDGNAEPGVGIALVVAAAGYVLVAALDRPASTWPLGVVLFAVVIGLRVLEVPIEPVLGALTLVGVGLLVLVAV